MKQPNRRRAPSAPAAPRHPLRVERPLQNPASNLHPLLGDRIGRLRPNSVRGLPRTQPRRTGLLTERAGVRVAASVKQRAPSSRAAPLHPLQGARPNSVRGLPAPNPRLPRSLRERAGVNVAASVMQPNRRAPSSRVPSPSRISSAEFGLRTGLLRERAGVSVAASVKQPNRRRARPPGSPTLSKGRGRIGRPRPNSVRGLPRNQPHLQGSSSRNGALTPNPIWGRRSSLLTPPNDPTPETTANGIRVRPLVEARRPPSPSRPEPRRRPQSRRTPRSRSAP